MSLLTTLGHLQAATPSFADFDTRAKAGEALNVVFFGASLTWGANAADPNLTSYRALMGQRLTAAYPQAHFTFWDGAIGGTGSQLGVFRLDRDCLRHNPDLVFLDFSANDDIYSETPVPLASYESLVRRVIVDGKAPVVQVIFPFEWNMKDSLDKMSRRTAHLKISEAYHTVVGDAIALAQERIAAKKITAKDIWPADGVHPCEAGYSLFADAAMAAFQKGVQDKVVGAAPEKMLYADTYMRNARVRISSLGQPPAGWKVGRPNLTSAFYDMLMSRWLDDQTIASNRTEPAPGADKKPATQEVSRLSVRFSGSYVQLFGESTSKSGKYRVYIDGQLVARPDAKPTDAGKNEFDAGSFAKSANGNVHLNHILADGLDPKVEHTLEIEPVLAADQPQELRFESICVAGGEAWVKPADKAPAAKN